MTLKEHKKLLAKNIKRLRKAHGMTQEDLAKKLKVSRVCVCMIETCKQNPTVHQIFTMRRVFECSYTEIFGDSVTYTKFFDR